MRLSFSTRGWGNVPWDELVETANDMGFAGIEGYDVLANDKFAGKGGPFDPYNLRATARDLRGRDLHLVSQLFDRYRIRQCDGLDLLFLHDRLRTLECALAVPALVQTDKVFAALVITAFAVGAMVIAAPACRSASASLA